MTDPATRIPWPDDLRGRRILVLGLGRFGGGVEAARFLAQEGAQAVISDVAPRDSLAESADAAEALGATLRFGPQTPALLHDVDGVLVSPAIPFDHPVVVAAQTAGLPVTTEVALFLARCPAPVVGITGTKGKSTTTALIAAMLEAAGRRVHRGGNIGRPLIGELPRIDAADAVVLELSSFQAWWCAGAPRGPDVMAVTNLFPDHLDRHGTFEAYAAAKRVLLEIQPASGVAAVPVDDEALRATGFLEAGPARRVAFGAGTPWHVTPQGLCLAGEEVAMPETPLRGAHNRRNMLTAAAALMGAGWIDADAVVRGACATRPLPHRLEPVAEIGGVLYLDDSNATNPRSTRCALEALERPVVLLLGGKEKGIEAAPLLAFLRDRLRAVVGLGTTGPALVAALADHVPGTAAPDMATAVEIARRHARPGDAVLLSPAHSSLDQFASFAVRGDAFQAAVRALQAAGPPSGA